MTTTVSSHFPARLWIVRHAESAGNVAREAALAAGAATIALEGRDVDVALSKAGTDQAMALGRWFAGASLQPHIILSSPYKRSRQTAEGVLRQAPLEDTCLRLDERLREKEFGILDGLTRSGIQERYPDVAAYRAVVGKFYHRPPGGESWCDVILRLRSLVATLSLEYAGKNVLIVTHQVVVLCLRYLLENMTEAEILAIDSEGDVLNCALTEYRLESGNTLRLERYNWTAPLVVKGAPVTAEARRGDVTL
jgi:2,3-bisphosphoglycerate-dependent phosphoglycerate mutase